MIGQRNWRRLPLFCGATALAVAGAAGGAEAHPHVLVTAKAEIVFDADGRMIAVRNIWQFDEAFSAFASQGLDANNDGQLSNEELAPLAQVNVDSLQEYAFFTYLAVDGTELEFSPPQEFWLEPYDGKLTLFFTLPITRPVAPAGETTLEVFDPEYFVAFSFAETDPIVLADAPAGCTATYQAPQPLDAQTMATLAAIPADERDLPPPLQDAASALANVIRVAC